MRALAPSVIVAMSLAAGCPPAPPAYDLEAMRDPQTCAECHAAHVTQWSGSMHAYAAEDPVFLAMNARGQRETDGALGDFCIRCHAPLAVALGATTDGLNLDTLPSWMKGVTCYWCHSVQLVNGAHNNPLVIVEDGFFRGPIDDPIDGAPHGNRYSPLHDRNRLESSSLCGSCHDIVTPAGVHLERTFDEWKNSLYSDVERGALTCGQCHMPGANARVVADEEAPVRRTHGHTFAGVDIAVTEFPEVRTQKQLVQRFLDSSLAADVCVDDFPGGTEITVTLENVAAGHAFPSGSSQDRRVWVELHAYAGDLEVFSTGVVPEGQAVKHAIEDGDDIWLFADTMYNDDGEEVHMFWEATSLERNVLPAPTAPFPTDPGYIDTHVPRTWLVPGLPIDRITVAVHMRPMGLEVLEDLVDSGDLDPAVIDAMPTFTLASTELEWRVDQGSRCWPPGR
jgi:hypothetical protein